MRVLSALTACALILGGASSASADDTVTTLTTFNVGAWQGGAYSAAGSTAFDHCAGEADYKSGVSVIFAVNKSFQWFLALSANNWNFTPGTTYPIAFTVDSMTPDLATATAITNTMVQVQLADSVALFKKFMTGERLKVEAAQQNFVFDLTNTSEFLPTLLKCAEIYAGNAPPSSNPFAATNAGN